MISGVHWLTMFKGAPNPDVLERLSKGAPAHKVLQQALNEEYFKLHVSNFHIFIPTSSITLTVIYVNFIENWA